MSGEATRIIRDSLPAIVAAMVVSGAGVTGGMFVGYKLIAYRVERLEADVSGLKVEGQDYRDRFDERLDRIETNTEYIRGRLEAST